METEKSVAPADAPVLVLRFNESSGDSRCALCGSVFSLPHGPWVFLDGTPNMVCRDCGQRHAPHLVALSDVGNEAEQCAALEDIKPHYAEVQKLWRAIEDYAIELEKLYQHDTKT